VTHDQEEAMTLGDKIVVMDQGIVQQVGTPREIFFQPRNRFVAQFVGTPSMNLFEGEVREEAGSLIFQTTAFEQPLTNTLAAAVQARNVSQIFWGVRPDTVKVTRTPAPNDIQGVVDVVELLGTRQLVFIKVNSVNFTVMIESAFLLAPGDTVYLHFEPHDIYLFEADSGDSLLSSAIEIPPESIQAQTVPT
jgi:multiple sugar transport system ATP-binding protein